MATSRLVGAVAPEEARISAKADQEVIDVDIAWRVAHVLDAHPSCLSYLSRVLNLGLNLVFHVVEVVLSDRKTLIPDGYKVVEADAGLFECLTNGAFDVGLAPMFVALGKGPLFRLSPLNEKDGLGRADADASVNLLGTCLITTKRLWKYDGAIHCVERMGV